MVRTLSKNPPWILVTRALHWPEGIVGVSHAYLSMECFFGREGQKPLASSENSSSQSSQNTTPENLDFIREGSFWVTESLFLLPSHGLARSEALLKMFRATVDLGIPVLFSSNRMCTRYKVLQVPVPCSCLWKPSSGRGAYGRETSQTLRRKSFRPSDLCTGVAWGAKHCSILFFPRRHTDGKCVWVKDTSGRGETNIPVKESIKALGSYSLYRSRTLFI